MTNHVALEDKLTEIEGSLMCVSEKMTQMYQSALCFLK